MSQPRAPEQVLDTLGDCSPGRRDEDTGEGIQCSQRMLSFSDALLSIIATVMILPVTHTEISPEHSPSGPRRCCTRQTRCSPPCGSAAGIMCSCSPSWPCTPAPACWPSPPPAC
uniref:Endosomal/lysosomal potassium channel TMEM175 n=1 Tax=Callithrix jacchus TaxID=9483 RepID=A0A8I3WAK2_CALJA